jgi:hypothetical protein
MTQMFHARGPTATADILRQLAAEPVAGRLRLRSLIPAREVIFTGSRNGTLYDAPDFDYMMATEIVPLIETIESAGL